MPPYFPQSNRYACSLAALRSVLAAYCIEITEEELIANVKQDYGSSFKNLWNPTIARLARQYNIDTTMYALWPLFKPELLEKALGEYTSDPEGMDINRYENPNDKDKFTEPLPLSYKEMFEAIKLGCKTIYGGLTENRLRSLLKNNYYIQTSIKTRLLYPGERDTFHSILIYDVKGNTVIYHDPARQPNMKRDIKSVLKAANGTGAFLTYAKPR